MHASQSSEVGCYSSIFMHLSILRVSLSTILQHSDPLISLIDDFSLHVLFLQTCPLWNASGDLLLVRKGRKQLGRPWTAGLKLLKWSNIATEGLEDNWEQQAKYGQISISVIGNRAWAYLASVNDRGISRQRSHRNAQKQSLQHPSHSEAEWTAWVAELEVQHLLWLNLQLDWDLLRRKAAIQ